MQEMKQETFQKYEAFTVGEVFDEKEEQLEVFIGEEGCFSSIFDFGQTLIGKSNRGWYDCKEVTPEEYKTSIVECQEKANGIGFFSNIIENHDEPRGVNQYIPKGECNNYSKKALALILLMRKGVPFIYQGQEIGMENTEVESIDQVDDIGALEEYKIALAAGYSKEEAMQIINTYSRDNARTPMQWNKESQAGFTTQQSWLALNSNYSTINVERQIEDTDSLLNFYKKMIGLRKNDDFKQTIIYGTFEPIFFKQKNIIAFLRKSKEQTLFIIANFQLEKQEVIVNNNLYKVLVNNYESITMDGDKLSLQGYQAIILELY